MTDKPEERVETPIEDVLPCEQTDIKEITEDHIVSENTYVVCAEVDMDLLESTESISNVEPVQEESSDSDESDVSSDEGIYFLCFFGPLGWKIVQLMYSSVSGINGNKFETQMFLAFNIECAWK